MSTAEQLRGDSLRRQLEQSRHYAAAHDMTLVEDLRDIGISAFHGANATEGTLSSFLAAVKANISRPDGPRYRTSSDGCAHILTSNLWRRHYYYDVEPTSNERRATIMSWEDSKKRLPRDNQGETAASIRMRMRRGWTAVARA
jgi:hypothetical protein